MRSRIPSRYWQTLAAPCLLALLLAACGSLPKSASSPDAGSRPVPAAKNTARIPVLPPAGSGRGGYYQDDGPGDNPPPDLLAIPDAEPRIEPYLPRANRPYVVFGQTYTPITDDKPFKQRGIGSWYGKKFHNQKTSSGELYDMYKMTAAHPTLPIPSYARVTNLDTGAQIIVRINDRGPFHSNRIIDLSYTAALKLGYLGKGSGQLELERLLPEDIERIANSREASPQVAQATQTAAVPAATPMEQRILPGEPALASSTLTNGFYLQLGAYSQAGNAEAMRSRLLQTWANALPPIEVVEYGVFYRLYSGPFATRAEAMTAAQQVKDTGVSQPLIVQR
ncbi:MAG TPA: septal ring lytic transglycosylase RlpA family protein [Paucimonas sp.]|nr:septal ring lytic transglycosylase RlpA family protein [Paucimonas sp.]